jgi:hypothetical protein
MDDDPLIPPSLQPLNKRKAVLRLNGMANCITDCFLKIDGHQGCIEKEHALEHVDPLGLIQSHVHIVSLLDRVTGRC